MRDFIKKIISVFSAGGGGIARKIDLPKRYRHFRSLLTANNTALELMSEMEQALEDSQPYSMSFVRGHCTALSVNVYKMVTNLRELSGGKYAALGEAFERITGKLEDTIDPHEQTTKEYPYIIPMGSVDARSAEQTGAKLSNLGELGSRLGLMIPDGFVITAVASRYFLSFGGLQDEINRRLKTLEPDNLEALFTTSAAIQQEIGKAPIPKDLEDDIMAAYAELASRSGGVEPLVAMRSSAIGEDGGGASFAGQYRTNLNVDREFILQSYKEIIAGKYKAEAIVYRTERGYRHQDAQMCVGCLLMVDASVSGVAYSRSPSDLRSDWVEITAAHGLAEGVVTGRANTESYRVSREAPHRIVEGPTGETRFLTHEQAAELARLSVLIEEHFGLPQDIEWSIDRTGQTVMLQSRPIPEHSGEYAPNENAAKTTDDDGLIASGGIMASRGVGAGPVRIVRSAVDILEFPKGGVLVVDAPLPEYAALAPRASAIVSETGGSAAHLATVAREFRIPALFGVAHAMERLGSVDYVTVDASGRRLLAGRRDDLLALASKRPSLMQGSPVEAILKNALGFITPLNLTNPGSPFFRPSSCETLHDITRFCHEKAVAEMFSMGSQSRRDNPEAKQLVDESAFHWWVLNLDNGFRDGYDMKEYFVRIDDIVSVPMHALWEGMTAVPWAGPPPVDLKGFGSILFRSTMNPQLDPAVRSNLADRNYFLVSKDFCNLSVRLGYHFTLAEAHIGGHSTENYVSFTFKGGAADRNRRQLRVFLLKGILEQYGFRTEQKMDSLVARVERRPVVYLLSRLRILGYLIIHTRQIDMVMEDQDTVERYKAKMIADINDMLAKLEGKNEEDS